MLVSTLKCAVSGWRCNVMSKASFNAATTDLNIPLKPFMIYDTAIMRAEKIWILLEAGIVCTVCDVQNWCHFPCCWSFHLFKQWLKIYFLGFPEFYLFQWSRIISIFKNLSTILTENFFNLIWNVTWDSSFVNYHLLPDVPILKWSLQLYSSTSCLHFCPLKPWL